MIATQITGQTRQPRTRPSGELTYCHDYQGPPRTAGFDPDRGHLWRDLEPRRLRRRNEDDQKFICDQCSRRRFLMPPETGETIVAMPPGWPPFALNTLAYDVEAGPYGYPALKRIIATKSTDGKTALGVPFDAVDTIYKRIRAVQDNPTGPQNPGDTRLKDIEDLTDKALQGLAQLASGQFPISEYLLSEPALLNTCLAEKNDPAPTPERPDGQWDRLPIHPAGGGF